MSGHLPECERHHPYHFPDSVFCICDRLRACEQRVTAQYVDGVDDVSFQRGVQAARDAVAALRPRTGTVIFGQEFIAVDTALAEIDGLKVDTPGSELIEHINFEEGQ